MPNIVSELTDAATRLGITQLRGRQLARQVAEGPLMRRFLEEKVNRPASQTPPVTPSEAPGATQPQPTRVPRGEGPQRQQRQLQQRQETFGGLSGLYQRLAIDPTDQEAKNLLAMADEALTRVDEYLLRNSNDAFTIPYTEAQNIYKDTGIVIPPKNPLLRFEIDDSAATVNINNINSNRLGDVFEHPQLTKYYPSLRDVEFRVDPELKASGEFNGRVIRVSPEVARDPRTLKSTILHEVQHFIQRKESFARGGSPSELTRRFAGKDPSFEARRSRMSDKVDKLRASFIDDVRKIPALQDTINRYPRSAGQAIDELKAMHSGWTGKDPFTTWESYLARVSKQELEEDLDAISDVITPDFRRALLEVKDEVESLPILPRLQKAEAKMKKIDDVGVYANQWYRSLLGEMEARDVQRRAFAYPSMKAKTPPRLLSEGGIALSQGMDAAGNLTAIDLVNEHIGYHGSTTSKIDRFMTKYIGSGEGMVARGWGLYFADKPSTSAWYRQQNHRRRQKDNPTFDKNSFKDFAEAYSDNRVYENFYEHLYDNLEKVDRFPDVTNYSYFIDRFIARAPLRSFSKQEISTDFESIRDAFTDFVEGYKDDTLVSYRRRQLENHATKKSLMNKIISGDPTGHITRLLDEIEAIALGAFEKRFKNQSARYEMEKMIADTGQVNTFQSNRMDILLGVKSLGTRDADNLLAQELEALFDIYQDLKGLDKLKDLNPADLLSQVDDIRGTFQGVSSTFYDTFNLQDRRNVPKVLENAYNYPPFEGIEKQLQSATRDYLEALDDLNNAADLLARRDRVDAIAKSLYDTIHDPQWMPSQDSAGLYVVDIKADQKEDYLWLDHNYNGQSPKVRAILDTMFDPDWLRSVGAGVDRRSWDVERGLKNLLVSAYKTMKPGLAYEDWLDTVTKDKQVIGPDTYDAMKSIYMEIRLDENQKFIEEKFASKVFEEFGIPGSKHLDSGSRADADKPDATYNYVIWDEDILEILAVQPVKFQGDIKIDPDIRPPSRYTKKKKR